MIRSGALLDWSIDLMLQAVRNVLMLPGLLSHLNVLISRELDCGGLFHRYCSAVESEPSASQRGFSSLLMYMQPIWLICVGIATDISMYEWNSIPCLS